MDIDFDDKALRAAYENPAEASRRWGAVVGAAYGRRVDAILAAPDRGTLAALKSLRLHALRGSSKGEFEMVLHGRWRLLLKFDGDFVVILEVSNHYGD